MGNLLQKLPQVRGKYRKDVDLSKVTWFRVGGKADVVFRPADEEDLSYFLQHKPKDIPVTILGLCSNVIVRDGGIKGVVIRLGGGFSKVDIEEGKITVGAGCLNSQLTDILIENGLSGLEFLSGIPGSIGGALAMNAGAYGKEVKDVLVEARAVDEEGCIHTMLADDMGFSYRCNAVPDEWIFVQATFKTEKEKPAVVMDRVAEIAKQREASQPIRSRTGGSTFRNPEGDKKAWQFIDDVGGRGLTRGGAQISEQHCNFMINTGEASARDLELLGKEIRDKVHKKYGVMLQWEIKRLGEGM